MLFAIMAQMPLTTDLPIVTAATCSKSSRYHASHGGHDKIHDASGIGLDTFYDYFSLE